jgi:SAM-dependent methyltransferase
MNKEKTGILTSYQWDSIKQRFAGVVISGILDNLPGIKTVYDIGCGTGLYVQEFIKNGMDCTGFELSPHAFYQARTSLDNIYQVDVARPISGHDERDLVFSVEVAEHIPERFADDYIKNLCCLSDSWVFITSSNKEGKYHLNPQPREYWINRVVKNGFKYRPVLSSTLMDFYAENIKIDGLKWFKDSLMIFKKER